MSNWTSFAACLHLMLASCALLSGASACDLPEHRTDERPDTDGRTTQITASIIVTDILGVDDVNQQLDLDFIGRFSWRDPRLVDYEGCRFSINDVWVPELILFNSSKLRALRINAREQVSVAEDGWVTYSNRYTGLVSSYHNLREFPFDSQNFEILIGSIEDDSGKLEFIADSENTWIADRRLNIEGWQIKGVGIDVLRLKMPHNGLESDVFSLTIGASRNSDYYIYRVMFLLAFVVAMSWVIFWVPPNRFEFQIGIGATSMLTAIAFNLALANNLPRLGYLTIMDKILIWSIFLVFLSIVEALITGLLVLNNREQLAVRLDRVARLAFPLMLAGGWTAFIYLGLAA